MFDVQANLLKNRLYITIGRIQMHKLENSVHILERAAGKLTPGFTCIARIVDIKGFDQTNSRITARIDSLLKKKGMSRLVSIGADRCQTSPALFRAENCTAARTMEAAEQILDQWELSRETESSQEAGRYAAQ